MKRFLILLLALCMLMLSACTDGTQETTTADGAKEPPLEENQDPDDPTDGEADGDETPDGSGDGEENEGNENGENEQKPGDTVELPKVPLK